jgi:tetrathionate reductase subunit B
MNKISKTNRRKFIKNTSKAAGAAVLVAASPLSTGGLINAIAGNKNYRWGFLIDLDKCIGCKACAVACKTESDVPLGVFRSSVKELDEGNYPHTKRSFVPWLCNHCKEPVCLKDCPVDEVNAEFVWPDKSIEKFKKKATYQRPDGVILIDNDRCVGCGACVGLCPYKVRFLNPVKKTVSSDAVGDQPAEKCDLCVSRLDNGVVPACVNTCQAKARIVGDIGDPDSEISRIIRDKSANALLPEKGTDPQCRYVSLNPKAYSEGRDTK